MFLGCLGYGGAVGHVDGLWSDGPDKGKQQVQEPGGVTGQPNGSQCKIIGQQHPRSAKQQDGRSTCWESRCRVLRPEAGLL